MQTVILDASAAVHWLFDEDPHLSTLTHSLANDKLVVPTLWHLEIANVVMIRERRKLLSIEQSHALIATIGRLPVEVIPEPAVRSVQTLTALCRPHQLGAYDGIYLELAVRLQLPLLTLDRNLRDAAIRVGVALASTT